ncbi:hypothetical protein TMatcc_009559 [Talaromyces marneffei ATCC 18224]|uniref:Rieske domain-containing protein n=2 Tax=Talaromyces marneffei TaxID=37727 RepID=B6QSN1_TALMQ|nr:uncharacterized protein EYB26_008808 [Talaromyces marneffei]EEA19426.1 conserved hypothetical protein [Talaromyces marneffei ATCC 18224]KAE8547746.1 hypothetical protein EYB25_009539 [Talaromyces marneffei]QGA21098.1 hypothetical protein EYB26_008808 [Talaromyces marneffei]
MNAFIAAFQLGKTWYRVGLTSDFADIAEGEDNGCQLTPSCKAFKIPNIVDQDAVEATLSELPKDLKDQVLIFKYRGKIHAIDHQCPHSSFPLSQGNLFDIEDFGIKLSTGITCPKHEWSFDITSGQADRGNYKLKVWEVQLRDQPQSTTTEKEVWVRRKQRIG